MGRSLKGGANRSRARQLGGPGGAAWELVRGRVLRPGRQCFHCGCADPDQVEHRISWQKRPDLMYVEWHQGERHLVPTHGQCPHCLIWCNNIAAGNTAPRDELGRSLPFPPKFLAAKRAQVTAKPAKVPETPARPKPNLAAGRAW